MDSFCDCDSPALVTLAIVHIRAKVHLDIRLHISILDPSVHQHVSKFLKSFNVGNYEVYSTQNEHTNVVVWPLETLPGTIGSIHKDFVDACQSIHALLPCPKLVSFENPWDNSTTGREKLQRALFHTVPLSESIRRRVRFARVFGPEVASYVFVHCGGVAAIDPRSIFTFVDGTQKYVSTLSPSKNASECILQGSNRENPLNRTIVETLKTMGVKRAKNETSSSQCACLFSCGRHALNEGELETFGLTQPMCVCFYNVS